MKPTPSFEELRQRFQEVMRESREALEQLRRMQTEFDKK